MVDIEALKEVARVNRALPDEKFYFGAWKKETSCGTVGCLIGNFCMAHPEDRLKIVWTERSRHFYPTLSGEYSLIESPHTPLAERFGITKEESFSLFCDCLGADNKEDYIKRLEKFIEMKATTGELF